MELIPSTTIFGPPDIFTEDILVDFQRFYFHNDATTTDELSRKLNALDPGVRQKLIVVTERLEFVDHLLALKNLLVEQKTTSEPIRAYTNDDFFILEIPERIVFHGREFNGVDHDIDALCFYLLLTCVECIEGPANFADMADWLIKNWANLCEKDEDPKAFIKRIKNSYYDQQGARRAFKRAFLEHLPNSLQHRLITNFAVVKLDNSQLNTESWVKWQGFTDDQKLKVISEFLYDNVRSKFTHESHRSFFPDTPIGQLPATQSEVLVALVPPLEDNLLAFLQDLLYVLVRNIFA